MSSGLNPRKRKALTRLYNLYLDGFNQQQLSAHFGFPRNSIDRMLYTGTISYSSAEKINAVKDDPEPTEKIRRQHAVEELPHFTFVLGSFDRAAETLAAKYEVDVDFLRDMRRRNPDGFVTKSMEKRKKWCQEFLERMDEWEEDR